MVGEWDVIRSTYLREDVSYSCDCDPFADDVGSDENGRKSDAVLFAEESGRRSGCGQRRRQMALTPVDPQSGQEEDGGKYIRTAYQSGHGFAVHRMNGEQAAAEVDAPPVSDQQTTHVHHLRSFKRILIQFISISSSAERYAMV